MKEYPCLWNTSLDEYKDRLKKVSASKYLASHFGVTVEERKKALHSMRTSMTREVKRWLENEAYVCKWKFYKAMDYLKEGIVKGLQNQATKEWTEEENETLINFYKDNEFLWNRHVTNCKDRDKRSMAMTKRQEMLNNRHSTDEIKSQLHSLKAVFERI